jgi:LytS/YehU family sensor histidine kinase
LFNSLSVLTSLVQVNADQSARFIQQLAKAYRYILEQKDASLVSLRAELDFLNAYFFLLRIRFENKIQLDVNISVDPQQFTLPPLTLQLLVENAVKHNKMSADKPLCINICNDRELLVVQNNRNARDQVEASTGTGLQNITSRYRMISRDSVQVTASPQTFTVVIPLIKNRNK